MGGTEHAWGVCTLSARSAQLVVRAGGAIRHPRMGLTGIARWVGTVQALIRGLTTELLRNGRITTTTTRAKAIRPYVDKMITLAKGGSLHQRRQALAFVYDKNLVHALFEEVPARYGERNGGYTRIFQTLPRRGDNSPMSIIEVPFPSSSLSICRGTPPVSTQIWMDGDSDPPLPCLPLQLL